MKGVFCFEISLIKCFAHIETNLEIEQAIGRLTLLASVNHILLYYIKSTYQIQKTDFLGSYQGKTYIIADVENAKYLDELFREISERIYYKCTGNILLVHTFIPFDIDENIPFGRVNEKIEALKLRPFAEIMPSYSGVFREEVCPVCNRCITEDDICQNCKAVNEIIPLLRPRRNINDLLGFSEKGRIYTSLSNIHGKEIFLRIVDSNEVSEDNFTESSFNFSNIDKFFSISDGNYAVFTLSFETELHETEVPCEMKNKIEELYNRMKEVSLFAKREFPDISSAVFKGNSILFVGKIDCSLLFIYRFVTLLRKKNHNNYGIKIIFDTFKSGAPVYYSVNKILNHNMIKIPCEKSDMAFISDMEISVDDFVKSVEWYWLLSEPKNNRVLKYIINNLLEIRNLIFQTSADPYSYKSKLAYVLSKSLPELKEYGELSQRLLCLLEGREITKNDWEILILPIKWLKI